MAKNEIKIAANVVETKRAAIAGAKDHPGWHALRTIASRITTPLLPDDYLKLANPLWSARELRGKVVEVRRETEDSATLVIKPGWGFSFGYEPGQYVGIGLLVDGRWRWRSYSLTSSPVVGPARAGTSYGRAAKTISITVKAMPEGFLSSHLVGGVPPGTVRPTRRTAGRLRHVRPCACIGAVRLRRLGGHADHVDAAHPGAPRPGRGHHPLAFGSNGFRRHVRDRTERAG